MADEQSYECNYTHDLRQKKKRWKDGRLILSSSNVRVMASPEENAAPNVRPVWQGKLNPAQMSALEDEEEVHVGNIIILRGTREGTDELARQSNVPLLMTKRKIPGFKKHCGLGAIKRLRTGTGTSPKAALGLAALMEA